MELLVLLATVVATSVVWFFVWKNNKKKFMKYMINLDAIVDRNDTVEEIEAKLDKALEELRASLIAKAKEEVNKLQ